MERIFDDYNYNNAQKVKIFGTLMLFDNKSKEEIINFNLDDVNNHLKNKSIEISNSNILNIVAKYYEKGIFNNLYLSLT